MSVRVLIVDDSKLARIVAARTVKKLRPDWTCVEAADADQALAVLNDRGADVAILDYNMPGKNGLDLAKDLRSRFPDMAVAIVTANIQDQIITGAREAEAHFVPKPLTEEGLRSFLTTTKRVTS